MIRAIALAEETGGVLYLVHLSKKESIEAVRWGKKGAIKLFVET